METSRLRRVILRLLIDRELSGYDIWKELSAKGIKVRTNYLYMILADMGERGLLKGSWVENRKGPRRHLYSISRKGEDDFRGFLREAVGFVMDAFVHENMNARDIPDHVESVRGFFRTIDLPAPTAGKSLVVTTPSFDPLICHPVSFLVFSEAFPGTSIWVVRPPGQSFYGERPNLTFLDGSRHDMPLKDGFADYLLLEGFPAGVSEEDTLAECARVVKSGGQLIVRVPSVMTEEKRPKFSNLAEFTSKLFYDFSGQDRVISVERVKQLMSRHSGNVKGMVDRGSAVIYGQVKKKEALGPVQIPRRSPKR